MAVHAGIMDCSLYKSAFSGEVIFAIETINQELYEGIAPKHYAQFEGELSDEPQKGSVRVKVLKNGGSEAHVATPDGEVLEVSAAVVHYS